MPGPPPKPTTTKRLHGNPGKQKLNDAEPQPREGIPACPRWIKGEARAEWNRIVPELEHMRLITLVDRSALAAYCQAWAELVECTEVMQAEGRVIEVPVCADGAVVGMKKKAHPIVTMQRDAFSRVKAFLSLFGLSPADRARLSVPSGDDKGGAFDKLMDRLRGASSEN